jgi:hypothetical protein
MPKAFPHWLPASLVRTPPEIPPASWPQQSSKPSYGLFDELPERLRPKSFEEQLAALDTLLPVPKTPTPQPNSSLWGGLLPVGLGSQPAQWPDASPASMPPSMATAGSLPPLWPPRSGVVPVLGGAPPAKIAGWPDDVPGDFPVLPVQWPVPAPPSGHAEPDPFIVRDPRTTGFPLREGASRDDVLSNLARLGAQITPQHPAYGANMLAPRLASMLRGERNPAEVAYERTPLPKYPGKVPQMSTPDPRLPGAILEAGMLGSSFLPFGWAGRAPVVAERALPMAERTLPTSRAAVSSELYNPPAIRVRPFARDYRPADYPHGVPQDAEVIAVDPATLRYSQRTAGGKGRADLLRISMREKGYSGEPIDVVQTQEGLVTIDNTRPAVALELGIESIPARVHAPSDPVPPHMFERFGDAKTWGEVLARRVARQDPPLPPGGASTRPRLPKEKKK